MQIERVSFNTIQLSVGCTNLRLSLVEVRLGPRLAIQLFYLVALNVEHVTVVRLLVRGGEATENQNVLVRDLEQAAALQTDPICVFLDLEVESLPLLSAFEVEFFYQVGPLTSVEASHYVQR